MESPTASAVAAVAVSPLSANGDSKAQEVKVYKTRWVVLALFSLSSFTNAFLWIQFASVQKYSKEFLHVDSFGVNCLSLCFMAFYIPGTLLASYLGDRFGTYTAVATGTALNILCALVRYLGSLLHESSSGVHNRYIVIVIGQCLGALAQPIFTNAPAKIAGNWFPMKQRDIATVIASMFNPLGNAAGSVVPSILTQKASDTPDVLLYTLIWTAAIGLVVVLFFREKPPTPPSRSAGQREALRTESLRQLHNASSGRDSTKAPRRSSTDSTLELSTMRKLWLEGRGLLADYNFLILFIGFAIGLGVFNALLTVIAQIVEPCGYDSNDAGMFGGVLIGAGLLGAAIAGPLLETTHKYVEALKGGICGAIVGTAFFLLMLRRDNVVALTVSFGVMGFALMPLLPIVLENAAETTYPTPEDTGSALLLAGGQLCGIAFIFALQGTIPKTKCSVTSASSILLACSLLVAGIVIFFFKKNYKRQAAEKAHVVDAETAVDGSDAADMKQRLLDHPQ